MSSRTTDVSKASSLRSASWAAMTARRPRVSSLTSRSSGSREPSSTGGGRRGAPPSGGGASVGDGEDEDGLGVVGEGGGAGAQRGGATLGEPLVDDGLGAGVADVGGELVGAVAGGGEEAFARRAR